MRVLLVEDSARLAALLGEGLRRAGWEAELVGSLADAEAALETGEYDALLLDRGLPDGDGLDLIRRLRHQPNTPPMLLMTALGDVAEVCKGLDLGADDYMVKPITLREVVARLNAAQRRGARVAVTLTLGALAFDPASRALTVAGRAFEPPRRERTLLEALLRAMPRPVAKEALEARMASLDRAVQPNAVEVYVHRLRSRLNEVQAGVVIHTVRGLGYRLEAASEQPTPAEAG
ncbi:MAG: Response regulator consisting of a CheY-like receiver domain and a winged-helix DNA-binding domain [Rhodospirillales bacterium]|jgi:DNA-binding response OmpR family regulator|nr:Response regulator consisting of a CheY-like receiver domain and a winged-helix DNA-binding domain [Rhodospirillales bacterium]MDB5382571.1 Response regulator consisting of a CheY-like receiver domain and a winged-helix DNA-binding domain [Rhodospirillales bacterium]